MPDSITAVASLAGMQTVAVVVGDEDYAAPPAMAQVMHEGIAGSTLTVIPKARHLTFLEVPGVVAGELKKASSSAFGLLEVTFASTAAEAGAEEAAGLAAGAPLPLLRNLAGFNSISRRMSRAEGVRIASEGSERMSPPLWSRFSMSRAEMTFFMENQGCDYFWKGE